MFQFKIQNKDGEWWFADEYFWSEFEDDATVFNKRVNLPLELPKTNSGVSLQTAMLESEAYFDKHGNTVATVYRELVK